MTASTARRSQVTSVLCRRVKLVSMTSVEDRFWSKVDQSNECWLWTAYVDKKGYGRFKVNSRMVFAHRVAYELLVGSIPEGLELDHRYTCPKNCVNPAHLQIVTHRENMLLGNTIAARNASRTHCIRGHEYTPENICYKKNGDRLCRKCWKYYRKKYSKK